MPRETHTGGRDATTAIVPGRAALAIGNPGTNATEGFRWTALSQVARLESGHTPSRSHPEYWDGDIPWIGIGDASAGHGTMLADTAEHVTAAGIEHSSTRLLPANTVCLSRTASIGYVVRMGRPMCTSQDFLNWVCGPQLDSRYLMYVLMFEADTIRERFAFGSTHRTLYYPDAKALHVLLPALSEQQAIAEVLGALDDKIAANSGLARNLHELAAALHERLRRDSELLTQTFGDVAAIGGGGTPSTKNLDYWNGSVCWAAPSDITALPAPYLEDTPRHLTEAGLEACSSPLYPAGTILMTSRATIGAFAIAEVPTAVNQGFVAVQPSRETTKWWIYHEMVFRLPEFLNHANGATFLELPRGVFRSLEISMTADENLANFDRAVAPLHDRARRAMQESATLAELRDTLLPALMDGTIRVKDAVRKAEDAL